MKISNLAALAILSASVLPSYRQAFAAPQTMDGVVSDSMCMKKHMMPGKSDAECIKECVKDGSTYVLVVGDKSYSLHGKTAAIAPFAGKHVQVQGEVKQNAIDVTAIHAAKAS